MSLGSSRFDWYEITFDGHDDGREVAKLHAALGGKTLGVSVVAGKGRNGYASCWSLERDGSVLAQVFGSSARTGEVHITVTSDACDELVPILRRLWSDHRVSRADISVDFQTDFNRLDAEALALIDGTRVSHRLITDSHGGATRYLGAPSSALRLRIYKKTEQLRALHPERAAEIPDGIVRVELQVRPAKREQKSALSTMPPADCWGLGKWTRDLASQLLGHDAPEVHLQAKRPSSWVRGLHFLGVQYSPMIKRRISDVGSEAVREVIEALGLQDLVNVKGVES